VGESRAIVVLVYGAVIGWCLCEWWQREKERITWQAMERCSRVFPPLDPMPPPPAPAATE
jgi:hypothetical protein